MLKVEVFSSPGCSKCAYAKDALKRIAAEIGGARITWREVDVLTEMDYAVKLGVLSTPAIAIDGRLVFAAPPSAKKLRAVLEAEMRRRFSGRPGATEASS